jgi:hypothetical protein
LGFKNPKNEIDIKKLENKTRQLQKIPIIPLENLNNNDKGDI